jgi:hypothetical protein
MGEAKRRGPARNYRREAAELLDQLLKQSSSFSPFEQRLLKAIVPVAHEAVENELDAITLTSKKPLPPELTVPVYKSFVDMMICAVSLEVFRVAEPGQSGAVFEGLVTHAKNREMENLKEVEKLRSNFPYRPDDSKPS